MKFSPIRVASSKLVLQSTWSMGVMVPCFAPLFWILAMLNKFDKRMTKIVPAIVKTVALLIFTWSKPLITSSLNGPIFTIRRNATKPSAQTTKKNKGIIFAKIKTPNYLSTLNEFKLFRIRATEQKPRNLWAILNSGNEQMNHEFGKKPKPQLADRKNHTLNKFNLFWISVAQQNPRNLWDFKLFNWTNEAWIWK